MKNVPAYQQYSSSCKCEVCDNSIAYHDFLQAKEFDYFVCSSFDCKRVMSQKSQMTAFQFNHYLQSQKKQFERIRHEAEIKKEYAEMIANNEERQNQKILQTTLANNSQLSKKEVLLVTLPSGLTELTTPANDRIKKYSEHLHHIIHEALENIKNKAETNDKNDDARERLQLLEKKFSENPKLQQTADTLCKMCKGGCCPLGGEHAYLSASTIMQLIQSKPELSTTEIHAQYLSRVSNETVVGACINQTKLGCSLPRDMRSNTCNGYYCEPVKSYLDTESHTEREGRKMVITVQRSNTNWNRFDSSFDNKIVKVAMINEKKISHIS